MGGILLVLITVISITVGQQQYSHFYGELNVGDECITLNNQRGICTKNKQICTEPQFHKKNINRAGYKFIQASQCSLPSENAVCCKTFNVESLLPSPPYCGMSVEDRVYGGQTAGLKDYPWMALLKYRMIDNAIIYLCGGSLISNRYVLTAAHCLIVDKGEFVNEVRLGEWDLYTPTDCSIIENMCADKPLDVGTEEIIIHKKYREDSGFQNDIALLRLNMWVQYTLFIKPVCLPMAINLYSRNYVNENLTIVGWGIMEKGYMSDRKLYAELQVFSTKKCDNIYEKKSQVKLNELKQLCAGGDGIHDACQGDSGGPLIFQDLDSDRPSWTIIGIVSFGKKKCAQKEIPTVYTRVGGYIKWILKNIRE